MMHSIEETIREARYQMEFSPPQAQPKKYEFWEVFGDDYNVGKVRPQTFISILALRIQYRFPSPEFVKNLFSSPESERTPPP